MSTYDNTWNIMAKHKTEISRVWLYLTLFVTFVNLAAVITVSITYVTLSQDIEQKTVIASQNTVKEFVNRLINNPERQERAAWSSEDLDTYALQPVIYNFHNAQNDLLQIWKTKLKNDIKNDLKEMLIFMWPLGPENNRQLRQSNGNELTEIFNQIAKSELDVLNKYCNNGSSICLPGQKGEPGIPGIQGSPGIQGVPGPSGATGTKGETGNVGAQGPPGSPGLQGVAGPKGDKGLNGPKGETGLKGDPGVAGNQGLPGEKGDVGAPGQPGSPGLKGVEGPRGDTGLTGPKGEAGLKGDLGMVGPQGPRGLTGEKGNVGTVGLPGSPGMQGIVGPKGDTGPTGQKGEIGLKGDPGVAGSQGLPGLKGAKGDIGIIGPRGLQGEPGSIGPRGPPGLIGPMGEKGAKGDTYRAVSLEVASEDCCANLAKPNFTKDSEQLKITEGSSVVMVCDATGSPKPSIKWDPNPAGSDMTRYHVGNDFIAINGTKLTDSGLYTCVANSALGTDKKTFTLQVIKHINLLNQPQNHTVLLGNPVSLECNVEGPLNPQITWYHVLPGGLKFQVTTGVTQIDHGSRLTITSFSPVDDGEYVCEASNGVETVDFSAYLHFYGPPHIISPTSLMAMKGDKVVVVCRADAHPPATTSWTYRPGITNAYKDADGNLVILNVQNSDAGEYYCTATNQFGSDKATITLSVKSPPEVTVIPEKIQLTPSTTNLVIECKASGDDPLNVKWTKDGVEITSDGHHFILPGNVLLVNNPKVNTDVGVYMCTASNQLGSAVATSTVYDYKGTLHCSSIFADCNSTVCGGLCPTGCDQDLTPIYGDAQYSMDSAICKSAIHNGSIQSQGGVVIWKKTSGTGTYTGSVKNGITSQSGSTEGAVTFI